MKLKFKLLDHDPWGCRGSKIAIATGVIAYYTLVNRIYKANWDQMDLSQIALIYIYIYSRTITYIYLSKTAMFKFKNKMIWSLKFWYPTFKWIQMTYAFIMLRPTAASQQSPHGNTAGSPGSIPSSLRSWWQSRLPGRSFVHNVHLKSKNIVTVIIMMNMTATKNI